MFEEVNPVSNSQRSMPSEPSVKQLTPVQHDSMTIIQEDEHELQESTKTYGIAIS